MNQDTPHTWIDPEFEARIVAFVLGEASDFEREEVERKLDESPEARLFLQRTRALHELLGGIHAGSDESEEEWKLSPERRNALLETLSGPGGAGSESTPVVSAPESSAPAAPSRSRSKVRRRLIYGIAAALPIAFIGYFASQTLKHAMEPARGSLSDLGVARVDMLKEAEQSWETTPLSERNSAGDTSEIDVSTLSSSPSSRSTGPVTAPATEQFEGFINYGSPVDLAEVRRGLGGGGEAIPFRQSATVPGGVDLDAIAESSPSSSSRARKAEAIPTGDAEESELSEAEASKAPPSSVARREFDERANPPQFPDAQIASKEKLLSQLATAAEANRDRFAAADERDSLREASGDIRLEYGYHDTRTFPSRSELRPEEVDPDSEPFSTFSLHVGDAAFHFARAQLGMQQWPETESVRIEEFVNALDYQDPTPAEAEKVGVVIEQARDPFLQQRNLLRISLATAARGRGDSVPLRLTLLLDNSGSMERPDRRATVRRALARLFEQMREGDEVSVIRFSREPNLLAESVPASEASKLVDRIAALPSEGGTNLESAIDLAFRKARENRLDGAQNRVVLLTDGAANLGEASPERLSAQIERIRAEGIAFDAAGIGARGLDDETLEALTRKGDGRYYLLDRPEDADEGFAARLAGSLRPAAGNVKVQVEFDPDRVGAYRLLGFDKHRLAREDFRDDSVDAAEMAAAEAGVALYRFQPLPGGTGDVGAVSVRFRDLASGEMVERRWPIVYDPNAPPFDQASPSLQLAASAAFLAKRLQGGAEAGEIDLPVLSRSLSELPENWQRQENVARLQVMTRQARALAGE